MDKLQDIIVTIIGILLLLPLVGVSQLGDITSGVTAWLIGLGVLVLGVKGLMGK
ncbi:MAG: hypothetical protein ACE5ES_00385 [Candidatus Nanoarchaeia archaeon]